MAYTWLTAELSTDTVLLEAMSNSEPGEFNSPQEGLFQQRVVPGDPVGMRTYSVAYDAFTVHCIIRTDASTAVSSFNYH